MLRASCILLAVIPTPSSSRIKYGIIPLSSNNQHEELIKAKIFSYPETIFVFACV